MSTDDFSFALPPFKPADALVGVEGEGFTAAADPKRYPDQIGPLTRWGPRRLLWNTSPWFYDMLDDFKPETMVKIDVGQYSPLLGESYPELAARSRSMHRSQGFGSGGS